MTVVISYDVQRSHTELKRQLRVLGFYDCVTLNNGQRRLLPNTTMFIDNLGEADAYHRFYAAVAQTFPDPGVEKILSATLGPTFQLNSNEAC